MDNSSELITYEYFIIYINNKYTCFYINIIKLNYF